MENELKALKTWSAMLDETEHTIAISQLIEETTLAQVDYLLKHLVFRKTELESLYTVTGDSDEDSCWSGETKYEMKQVRISQQTPDTPVTNAVLFSSDVSSFAERKASPDNSPPTSTLSPSLEYMIPRTSSPTMPNYLSPSIQTTIRTYSSPLQKSPVFHHCAPSLSGIPSNLQDLQNPLSKTAAKLNLVRLTLSLHHHSSSTYTRRSFTSERRIPTFPIEGKDPKWLTRWLHSLRLHKYAKNLQGLSPRELLELSEEDIRVRGVDTIGARNKLVLALREAKASLDHEIERP